MELQKEIEDALTEKEAILGEKLELNQKIGDIDNKIYELCCLPEFSHVWLLGEDRFRNLYWVIGLIFSL